MSAELTQVGLQSEPPVEPGHILVVDDRPRNLQAIELSLQEYEHRMVRASSGEEALRLLLQRDFSLILLDVQLPDMNGFQVAEMVRSRERSRDIPIIFVTAFSQTDSDVLQGYALGAVDFLFKPIVPEVLRAKVSVLLALQERTAEVSYQAALLRAHERREHVRAMESERRLWEEETLRRQMEFERRRADELERAVNELERTEAKLNHSNQALEELDRRKNEFLAYLAHELRNPLAPLAAGLELVAEELPTTASEAQRAHEAMDRQLSHLTRLVDDLLDVARINSDRIELDCHPIALSRVIEQAVQTSDPLLRKREQQLVVDVEQSDKPIEVLGDTVRLTQVLSNLLNNASRYSPPGSRIDLRLHAEGDEVCLTVSDEGCGISGELLPRVFEMFVRSQNESGGLGVGLSLVDRLVRLHGGRVEATSDGLNEGATFTVWLPRQNVSHQSEAPPREIDASRLRDVRVVVVEDSDDIRDLVRLALERRGLSVYTASDGEAGVALILKQRPDIAVIDLGLPQLTGCEVAEQVRKVHGPESIRLIAMTGYGQAEDRDRAKKAGFDAHLVKPVRPRRLVEVIAETLGR